MAFNPESERLTNELIIGEYTKAREDWGDTYNSLHEAYAVLLEEVEEAKEQIENIEVDICDVWRAIKNNASCIVKDNCKRLLNNIETCIKELAQVGGVLMKTIDTLEVKE